MNTEQAYGLVKDGDVAIENMYWRYCGFLVTDGKCFALVDEEYDGCLHFPFFIKAENDANEYLLKLQAEYKDGEEAGKESFKRDLAGFIKPK